MPNRDFEPLSDVLAGWFDCSLDELPDAVRERIASNLWLATWDAMSESQRRKEAEKWDSDHDPARAEEREFAWNLWCELDEVRREIAEWDALRPQSITEKAEQANRLHALRDSERRLLESMDSHAYSPAVHEPAELPQSRQRQQEREILRVLKELGYDPQRVPRAPAGKPGPKAEVRKKLPDMTPDVFRKAWERLRGYRDIADAE